VSYAHTTSSAGHPWTDADLDSLQAGIKFASGGTAATVRVTQVFVTVNVGDSVAYTYANGATQMNTLTSLVKNGVTASFTYDANGNLDTKTGGWDYDWDFDNRMTLVKQNGAQQQAYTYDGLGRRVKVDGTSSSTWTVSIVSGMDAIYERDNAGSVTKYVYAKGMRIAKITSSGEVQYYLGDHLGSTRKVLDASRNTVFSTDYEPFGKPYAVTGSEAYKYTGERHDDPTGFVYLRARQYDPDLGRFISLDPVLGSLSAPQTLNRYAYVVNNPLKYTDPTGRDCSWNPLSWGECAAAVGNFLYQNTVGAAINSYNWYIHASASDQRAFWAGVLTAVAIGVVVGLSCVVAACAGLVLLAVGIGTSIGGSLAAGAVYQAAGGQSQGGLQAAMFWGGIGAGAGFVVGGAIGSSVGLGATEAATVDFAPENAETGFPGGLVKTLAHRPADVAEEEWLSGVVRIANDPDVVTMNPGGGYRAFGMIQDYEVRVVVGPYAGGQGGIITAFTDSSGIP